MKNYLFLPCLLAALAASEAHAVSYDGKTGQVTIDTVQVGDAVYHNVIITIKDILGYGGSYATPRATVTQGGLTWSQPSMTQYKYADAVAYCNNSAFNAVGSTGWRLPTIKELTGSDPTVPTLTPATGGVYGSGVMTAQGWPSTTIVWSSTPTTPSTQGNYPGYWNVLFAKNTDPAYPFPAGSIVNSAPPDWAYVTCVKP
jgi:hypothetical protein